MAGASQTAAARRDHEDGARSLDERQLRLVPPEDPPATLPRMAPAQRATEEEGRSGAVLSLAAYVLGLSAGSPCFCCGEPLTAPDPPGDGSGGHGELICVACAAEVQRDVRP